MPVLLRFVLLIGFVSVVLHPAALPEAHAQEPATSDAEGTVSATLSTAELRAQGLFVRGLTRARLDDPAGAIEAYEAALDLVGEEGALLLALAEAHRAQGTVAEAAFYADRATSLLPEAPEPLRLLAELHRDAGRAAEAMAAYERLLATQPDDEAAWAALADLHADAGDLDAAADTYRQFWQQATYPRAVGLRLIRLLDAADRADEAVLVLNALVAAEPDSYPLRLALARRLTDLGRHDDALSMLDAVLEDYPEDQQALLLTAHIYQEDDRRGDASDVLNRMVSDRDPEALFAQAARLFNQAQTDPALRPDAEAALQRLLDVAPRPDALHMLGTLRFEAEAYDEAASLFARAVEAAPRRPDWWAQALDAALLAGDLALATRLADDALLFFPGQTALVEAGSQAYIEAERFADAVAALRTLDAPTAAHLERLGDAELARGDADAARSAWQQALDLDPDNASVRTKLSRIP